MIIDPIKFMKWCIENNTNILQFNDTSSVSFLQYLTQSMYNNDLIDRYHSTSVTNDLPAGIRFSIIDIL